VRAFARRFPRREVPSVPVVPLAQLLGQPDVSAFLRGVVARGRYANAYLFHGPAGVGKGTAALAFARAALCERVPGAAPAAARAATSPSLFGEAPAPVAAADGDDACGECRACSMCASLQHPDLKFLFPVSGEEKEVLDEVIPETLAAWREQPLFAFVYDRAASIRLFMTRELQREMAYRPYEASRRVVVVRDCDRMREDQYSALLKSIEEPGATTLWVLTTSRPSRVPATIRSRCQRVRFAPLPEATIRNVLETRAGVPAGPARTLAALAAGSLARALLLSGEDAIAERDAALALLQPARSGDAAALWKASQSAAGFGKGGREKLRRAIEFQELWLRDLLRTRYGAPPESLVNGDSPKRLEEIRKLAAGIDANEIRRRLMVLEEALRAIDGNVSADLTLFSTLSRVAGNRLGEGAWPPHGTARWDY
jgi:DNA polymerase-3 subunit delta'